MSWKGFMLGQDLAAMSTTPYTPAEPSSSDCENNTRRVVSGGWIELCAWYPQMGGYCGKCVVRFHPEELDVNEEPCFDVWVWHDGEFPFGEDEYPGKVPARLHHCSAEQFRDFADVVERAMGKSK